MVRSTWFLGREIFNDLATATASVARLTISSRVCGLALQSPNGNLVMQFTQASVHIITIFLPKFKFNILWNSAIYGCIPTRFSKLLNSITWGSV
jgi:hypothetical protein